MKSNNCYCKVLEYLNTFEIILKNMIYRMNSAKLDRSISHNFIVQMLPHHRAAIDMSRNILKYTSNDELMNISTSIISEQTKSIANMKTVLCCCTEKENCICDLQTYQSEICHIKDVMFSGMRKACADNNLNCNFIREMIPHHLGAVEMSKTTLKYDICPQLIPILNAIIISQEKGIEHMQNLLEKIECMKHS